MIFKTFGEWLRHRRLQLDISPFKMSEALGYKRVSAIYNFEYGLSPVPMAKWPAFARVLDLPLERFLVIMDRYNPQKVKEFKAIQTAESGSDLPGDKTPAVKRVELQWMAEKEVQGQVLRPYHLAEAKIALVFHEEYEQDLFGHIDGLWSAGQRVGAINILEISPFPGVAVVEALKQVSMVGILEAEREASVAAMVKAAFLDALTGVVGYPHIHRVPKIYTCYFDEGPIHFEKGDIEALLESFEDGSDTRMIRLSNHSRIQI